MGKKVRKVPYSGWDDPQLNKAYNDAVVKGAMSNDTAFRGVRGLVYDNVVSKKKKQDLTKEEIEFGEELKAEREYEEALRQQEEELKAADEFSKLTDVQQAVVSQLAKNKKLDLKSPAFLKDKEISNYINSAKEYNRIRNNDSEIKEENRASKELDKAKGFWDNTIAGIDSAKQWLDTATNFGIVGNNTKEKNKYEKLQSTLRQYEKPIATQWLKKLEEAEKAIKDNYINYDLDKDKEIRSQFSSGDVGEKAARASSLFMADNENRGSQNTALSILSRKKNELSKFINDEDGIFSGAGTMAPGLVTAGLSDLVDNANVAKIVQKRRNNEKLRPQDEKLLEVYNLSQQVDNLNLAKDRFWYRTGQGVAQSAVFIEQTVLTELITGGLGGFIGKAVVTPLSKKVGMSLAMKSLSYAEGKAVANTLEFLATKGVGYVEKGILGTGELLTQSALMPSTYSNAAQKYIGQTQRVIDKEGNEKILVSKSERVAYEKEAKAILSNIELKEKELKSKEKLTDAEQKKLQELSIEKQKYEDALDSIYDPNKKGNNILEDVGERDALIYGYLENVKELTAEKYVGSAIDKGLGLGSKFNKYIGSKTGLNSAYNKVGKALEPISSKFKAGNEFLNDLGKLSSNLSSHTGTGRIFNSLPAEMAEEVAVQLMPTYMSDYSEQLKTLANPTFYMDVAAQTLILGGGPTMIGTSQHLSKYAFDKKYREQYKANRDLKEEVRNLYKNIDKSVSEDELAKHIAMKSSNTLFNVNEYTAKINELRKEGKKEEADSLQRRSLLNIAAQALRTDTLEQFERTLSGIQNNDNLTDETKREAAKFIPKLQEIKRIQDEYKGRVNFDKIVEHSLNNLYFNDTIEELDQKLSKHKSKAEEIIKLKKELGVLPEDFNLGFGIGSMIYDNEEVNSELFKLSEENVDLQRALELQYTKDLYTEAYLQNQANLSYQLNPKNQASIKAEYDKVKQDLVVETTDSENLSANKEQLVEEGNITKEDGTSVGNELDKAALEKEIKEQELVASQVKQKDSKNIENENDSNEEEDFEPVELTEQQNDFIKNLIGGNQNKSVEQNDEEEVDFDEDEPLLNAPYQVENNEESENIINTFQEAFGRGTFKGVMASIGNVDPFFAEKYYNHLVESYNRARPDAPMSKEMSNKVYEELFGDLDSVNRAFSKVKTLTSSNTFTQGTNKEEQPVTTESTEEVESSKNVEEVLDVVTNKKVKIYKGYKTSTPDVKLAFVSQNIELTEDGTKYEVVDNTINPKAFPALHYENFKVGDKVKLDFDWDFFNQEDSNITVYTDVEEDNSITSDTFTIQEFVKYVFGNTLSYESFLDKISNEDGRKELLSNETFLNYMPTKTTLPNGTQVNLGINSRDWWNARNVALEFNEKGEPLVNRQKQLIKEAKERNVRLRNSLSKGNSIELTVTERGEGFHNKLLLETEVEKETGVSSKFNSIKQSFKGNSEAALQTLGLGAIYNDTPASTINNGKLSVKIGNKEVFLTEANSNIREFKTSMINTTGGYNGRAFMVHQTGYSNDGSPFYTMRALVTNHPSALESFKGQYELIQHLKNLGNLLNSNSNDRPQIREKAEKIYKYFKTNFNIDITDWKQFENKLGEYYPQKMKVPETRQGELGRKTYKEGDVVEFPLGNGKTKTVIITNPFIQNYKINSSTSTKLPNLLNIESITELEEKILNNTLESISPSELFINNVHTQYIFSEITDENHSPIWTSEVQPKIKFSDDVTEEQLKQEQQEEINSKKILLEGNKKIKEQVEEQLSQKPTKTVELALKEEKKKIEREILQLENELAGTPVSNDEVVDTEDKKEGFNEEDIFSINQHLMYTALNNIETRDFTREDILEAVVKQYYKLIDKLKQENKTEELKFVEENSDKILGNDTYDGSVREMIDTLYDISPDEEIDFTSEYVKDQTKESYEIDITASLSLRVKMMLSGIRDTRVTTQNFAGLPTYFTFKDSIDFLQQGLSQSSNNNLASLKEWIFDKVKKNPSEFKFYYQIYSRLRKLEKNDKAFLNEIMYFLYQPKVDMTFMMFSQTSNGEYKIQKFDANSKNPDILKTRKWAETLKTSPLIEVYEGHYYKVNKDVYSRVKSLYSSIIDSREKGLSINHSDLSEYFSYFGIKLNSKTLQALEDNVFDNSDYTIFTPGKDGSTGSGILANNQIFENLYKNITQAVNNETLFQRNSLTSDVVKGEVFLNPLTSNTTGSLKRLVALDNALSAFNYNSMRIAGKSINPFQQPKAITNIINKIKNSPEYLERLNKTALTSNSIILEMLDSDPKFREHFSFELMSLEALKKRGEESREDMGPTDLSDLDAIVTLFNLFGQNDGDIKVQRYSDKDISLRKGSMIFPTLSDSSQQPILNTVLINLQKSNFNDLELEEMSNNLLEVIREKLIENELNRIAQFINVNKSTNIKGHDVGAQLINSLPSINSIIISTPAIINGKEVEVKRPLIEVFKNYNNSKGEPWRDNIQSFLDTYGEDINKEINSNINFLRDELLADFEKEGILEVDETTGDTVINNIDSKYLDSKGNMSETIKSKLIATDYIINNLISLNEIQNLFAGDVSNYFKDSMLKNSEFGLPKVDIKDLADFYYPELSSKDVEFISKNFNQPKVLEEVKQKYPKLLSATSIALTDTLDQRVEDIVPIARIKMVEIYEGVQNNLSKRLKELISPGNQYPNSMGTDQKYKQIMLQDIENSSEVLESLAKLFHPDTYEKHIEDIREFKKLDDIYPSERSKVESEEHSRLKSNLEKNLPEIKSFLKTASTDAQEYATWQDNLNQLRNQGRVTQEEFNQIFDKLTAQSKDLEDFGYITEENKWKPEEMELRSKSVMQVSKPLYSGHHLETLKGDDNKEYNYSRYVYIKSSSFALTPELTAAFPKLNNLRKNLEKMQIINNDTREITQTVRASYDSANKVGAVKTGLPISELYKDNPNMDLVNTNTIDLEKSNFYIQQDKPFKSDKNAKKGKIDEITRATQFEKILLGDGINKITENIFPNLFDKDLFEELGIEYTDKIDGPTLKKLYDKIYEKEQKLLTEEFNRELGITDINDIVNGKPEVLQNIIDKLKSRLTNKQDLKSLELEYTAVVINSKGKEVKKNLSLAQYNKELKKAKDNGTKLPKIVKANFKIPLYMMPNSNKFESVLNSIINKSNINLKLPGFSSPVASQEGFDYKGFSEEEFEKAKKNGLITTKNFDPSKGLQATRNEDGKLKYAQVFIANKFKVLNKETGKYDYIDLKEYVDENNQIDTNKLPEELLSMFSFRIPTSSHQSGVIIEIAGFLPHTSGDLMIVPKDHTVQIGEDYDIDTRYVYQYHYIKDLNGNLKKLSYSDIEKPEKSYEEVEKEYLIHRDNLWREYYRNISKVEQDNPLSVTSETEQINPLFEHNKNIFEEILRVEEALDNFELDKLLNAIFKEDYEVEDVTKEFLRNRLVELENRIIPNNLVKEESEKLKEEYRAFKKYLREAYYNEKSEIGRAWKNYNKVKEQRGSEIKVLQNNLISLYKSVFSSDDSRVQSLINKTLSTENAETTVKEMSAKLKSGNKSPYYTLHSPKLQRDILKLGASGKIGIGEQSNAVTMNSIFQQSDYVHKIYSHIAEIEEGVFVQVPFDIVLGKLSFNGVMGKVKGENNVRVSELGMEDQNSATDNQKLQIMGQRNEDKNTMGVLKILHAEGIDKDDLIVNGKQLSYASLFINQPIIREYSELVNKYSSSTSGSVGNPKTQAEKELLKRLEAQIPKDYWAKDKVTKEPIVGQLNKKAYFSIASKHTSKYLYDSLLEQDVLDSYVVLKNFLDLKRAATTYNEVQRVINIEKDGMGISYFDSIDNMETLLRILNDEVKITNVDKMIGQPLVLKEGEVAPYGYVPVITKDSSKTVNSNLYTEMSEGSTLYVLPSSHYSHKIVNSISLGYNTYNGLFPYNNRNISLAINQILKNTNISLDKQQEMKYQIVSNLKDYILTNNESLFGQDINKTRKELFFEDKEAQKESLASYLLKLSNNPMYRDLFNKPFFRDLTYQINDETYPSLIMFNNSDISKINTLNIYNNFYNMMDSNTSLPSFNGKKYNYKELMKDLLKYSLLADQANGAIGFRQHLPIELFDKYGVTQGISNTTNKNTNYQTIAYHGVTKSLETMFNSKIDEDGTIRNNNPSLTRAQINSLIKNANSIYKQNYGVEDVFTYDSSTKKIIVKGYDGNNIKSTFVKQFIQHNPDIVPYISGGKLNNMLKDNGYSFKDIDNIKEFYYETRVDFITLKDSLGKIKLYEKVADHFFKEIPVLGVFGMKEYSILKEQKESLVDKNNTSSTYTPTVFKNSKSEKAMEDVQVNNLVVKANLKTLTDALEVEDSVYSPLFKLFKNFVNLSNVQIIKGEPGNYSARYLPSGAIKINSDLLNSENFNVSTLSKIVAEEMLHHITVNTIHKYIEFTGINRETGKVEFKVNKDENGAEVVVPAEVISLVATYNEALKHIIAKHGIDAVINKIQNNNNHLNSEKGISNELYRVSNIHEFIAGIFMKDEVFAKEMANTPYKNEQVSIYERFLKLLERFFNRVIPSYKKQTISGEVAVSLTNLLEEIKKENKNRKVTLNPIFNSSEKIKEFSKTLKLVQDLQENYNIRQSLLEGENDVTGDYPIYEKPKDLEKFDGSRRANNNQDNNQEEGLNAPTNNVHNAEIMNPDLIQFAFDPWDSEQLENEGYTYIGNLDIEEYGYPENGNYPAYYKFEENNISTFAEQVLKCE